MKKIIINILKIISWILIYALNFCVMISLNSDRRYIMPLMALIAGPVLFLVWRFYAERDMRYARKGQIYLKKQEFKRLIEEGIDPLSNQELTKPKRQRANSLNKEDISKSKSQKISNSSRQDLNKSKNSRLNNMDEEDTTKLNSQKSNNPSRKNTTKSNKKTPSRPSRKDEYDYEDVDELKDRRLRRQTLNELKSSSDNTIVLEPDHFVRNIILIIIAIVVFVVSYTLFISYKVQILAKLAQFKANGLF